jgi:alkaline phosphatase
MRTRALVLVPVPARRSADTGATPQHAPEERLAEAVGLAQAIDLDVADGRLVPLQSFRPATLFGRGKVDEIAAAVAALDVLAAKEKPFWLMVEAGDVDWASHGNDIDAAIGAVNSGDAAFRAITGWVESHGGWDDTAVIVTSDHGHMFVLEKPEAFAR